MSEDLFAGWHFDNGRKVTKRMEKWREKHVHTMGDKIDKSEGKDLCEILECKERDLVLAAELGKSLLEKNNELNKQNKIIAKEYLMKLQVLLYDYMIDSLNLVPSVPVLNILFQKLEQEKFQLQNQLEVSEEEYVQKISDLQTDIKNLKKALSKYPSDNNNHKNHTSQLVTDLTEQNQRLASQLRYSAENEKDLREQINSLRLQFHNRKSSIQEHFDHAASLREELYNVMEKKSELEKMLEIISGEKLMMKQSMEKSNDKIIELKKNWKNQECIFQDLEKDTEELRVCNNLLLKKLETLSGSSSSSFACQMTLFSELEMSCSDQERSCQITHFDIIEEVDENCDIEEMDDSGCEMLCETDKEVEDLKKEVINHQF